MTHSKRWLLALALCASVASAAEVSYPPRLPGGARVATVTSPALVTAPPMMEGVPVAKAAPTIDFLYYPCQTYKAKTWSDWGDGVAADGKYYSAIGDHNAPAGNAYVYEYDASTKSLRLLADLRKVLQRPDGHYAPGKIHSRIDLGDDGWLYFATHRGSTGVTNDKYHYEGDWILRTHPATAVTEIVAHGPVGKQCIPCSVLDPKRLIFYGGTVPGVGKDEDGKFFAYDTRAKKLLCSMDHGPGRYMMFAKSTGRVYFVPGLDGPLYRYDPEKGGAPEKLNVTMGIRAATQETPQGFIYAVSSKGDASLWCFDTRAETAQKLGSAVVGSQDYITSLDADPTGRYLYYVPGAHGGSERDGTAVVQFDTATGKKKVIAFLYPFLREKLGFTPIGTFSTAVDAQGDKLYITWNGSLTFKGNGRPSWDACALTVIHIPESERPK